MLKSLFSLFFGSPLLSLLFPFLHPTYLFSLFLVVFGLLGCVWLLFVLLGEIGIQAACINAATLALIDAGIPMKDYVTAVSAGCIGGKPLLDINYLEETARGPELTVAILPKSKKITTLEMESRVHADIFEGVLALAIEGCCTIEGILDKVITLCFVVLSSLLIPRLSFPLSLLDVA